MLRRAPGGISRHAGLRTLLIDADLRCPTQHRFFNMEQKLGLSAAIREKLPLNMIRREVPGTPLLGSGYRRRKQQCGVRSGGARRRKPSKSGLQGLRPGVHRCASDALLCRTNSACEPCRRCAGYLPRRRHIAAGSPWSVKFSPTHGQDTRPRSQSSASPAQPKLWAYQGTYGPMGRVVSKSA